MTASDKAIDRRARRHQQTRREVLDASWALAEQHGIAGLSLRQVAKSVGMQAPSLYTYFDSKDALFDAMFVEGYHQLGAATDHWTQAIEGLEPTDALALVMERWIRFCQASLARYQLLFTRAIPGWEPSVDAYTAATDEFARMATTLASLGLVGEENHDLFTALSSGLAAQQLANDPDGDRWASLTPAVARMMINHAQGRDQ